MVAQHEWVKHTITPVSVVPDLDDDNQVVVLENKQAQEDAEDSAVYGCNQCGLPMPGNTDTLCEGPDHD